MSRLNRLLKLEENRPRREWCVCPVEEGEPDELAGSIDGNILRVPRFYASDPVAGLSYAQKMLLRPTDRIYVDTTYLNEAGELVVITPEPDGVAWRDLDE